MRRFFFFPWRFIGWSLFRRLNVGRCSFVSSPRWIPSGERSFQLAARCPTVNKAKLIAEVSRMPPILVNGPPMRECLYINSQRYIIGMYECLPARVGVTWFHGRAEFGACTGGVCIGLHVRGLHSCTGARLQGSTNGVCTSSFNIFRIVH